ncbi:MAG: site-2 protease family protein [Porticoccaceae bacterium]
MTTHKMIWSRKLTRIAGIDVHVHLTFFLILLWIGLSVWRQTADPIAVAQGIGFILILFACVVMHEFGHALTARRFGIKTLRITLLPIGGVATMEKMPDDPKQEILVALAGPAVNMAIAAVIWLYLSLGINPGELPTSQANPSILFTSVTHMLYSVMYLNILLGVFNLLPAFPMDGGRVLRAALALYMPHYKATEKAATVGQGLALVMFILGLLYNPFLMLISVFIWLGAAGEAGAEKLQHALHGVTAKDIMLSTFATLNDNDTLGKAIDLSIHSGQHNFPVKTENGDLKVLTHPMLLTAVREHGEHTALRALSLPALTCVEPHADAEALLKNLHSGKSLLFGVTKNHVLSGLISMEEVLEWLSLRQETAKGKKQF